MNRIAYILLVISNVLFISLYVILCFNNRLATDDFHFLANVNNYGILEGTYVEYKAWSSRWLSVLFNHSIHWFNINYPLTIALFGLLNLSVFVTVVCYSLKVLRSYLPISKIQFSNKWVLLNTSIFIIGLFFLATLNIGETWFWLCSTTSYLWSCMCFLLGFSILFNPLKSSFQTVLAIIAFFYIGGSSGPLAIVTLTCLFVKGLYHVLNEKKSIFYSKQTLKQCLLSFSFCIFSFLILYISDGNRKRELSFQQIGLAYSLLLNFKMIGILALKHYIKTIPMLVVFSLPAILLGNSFQLKNENFNRNKRLYFVLLVFVAIVYIFQLTITYKTQDIAALRATFFISMISVCCVLVLLFYLGQILKIKTVFKNVLVIIPLALSGVYYGYQFINQYSITTAYAKAYEYRMEKILYDKVNMEIVEVYPLPTSGMLKSAEISSDTAFFSNQHLKNGLELSYSVRVK